MRAFLFVLLLTAQAPAGQAGISGTVQDSSGGVIPGATVSLSAPSLQKPLVVSTNAAGVFRFAGVSSGEYDLTVRLAGFQTSTNKILVGAQNVAITVGLQLGTLSEFINVARPAPIQPAPAPPVAASNLPVRVGGDIQEPRKARDVRPVYPPEAAAAGVTGVVIMEATLSRDGSVRDVRVLRGVPQLDGAALTAVRQWMFTPARLNGQPVDVVMVVTISFGG